MGTTGANYSEFRVFSSETYFLYYILPTLTDAFLKFHTKFSLKFAIFSFLTKPNSLLVVDGLIRRILDGLISQLTVSSAQWQIRGSSLSLLGLHLLQKWFFSTVSRRQFVVGRFLQVRFHHIVHSFPHKLNNDQVSLTSLLHMRSNDDIEQVNLTTLFAHRALRPSDVGSKWSKQMSKLPYSLLCIAVTGIFLLSN